MRGRPRSRINNIIFLIIIAVLGVLLLIFSPFILYLLGRPWTIDHPMCCEECLAIHNNSYIDKSRGALVLFLSNCGRGVNVIYRVELNSAVVATYIDDEIILRPGEKTKLELQLSGIEIVYGHRYRVEIYTRAGNIYRAFVEAR